MFGIRSVILIGIIVIVSQISCESIPDYSSNSETTSDQEDKKNNTVDVNFQLNVLSETINGWIKNIRSKVSRNVKPSMKAELFPKSVQNVGKLAIDERGNYLLQSISEPEMNINNNINATNDQSFNSNNFSKLAHNTIMYSNSISSSRKGNSNDNENMERVIVMGTAVFVRQNLASDPFQNYKYLNQVHSGRKLRNLIKSSQSHIKGRDNSNHTIDQLDPIITGPPINEVENLLSPTKEKTPNHLMLPLFPKLNGNLSQNYKLLSNSQTNKLNKQSVFPISD